MGEEVAHEVEDCGDRSAEEVDLLPIARIERLDVEAVSTGEGREHPQAGFVAIPEADQAQLGENGRLDRGGDRGWIRESVALSAQSTSEPASRLALRRFHFRLGHLLRVSGAVWQGEGGGRATSGWARSGTGSGCAG